MIRGIVVILGATLSSYVAALWLERTSPWYTPINALIHALSAMIFVGLTAVLLDKMMRSIESSIKENKVWKSAVEMMDDGVDIELITSAMIYARRNNDLYKIIISYPERKTKEDRSFTIEDMKFFTNWYELYGSKDD